MQRRWSWSSRSRRLLDDPARLVLTGLFLRENCSDPLTLRPKCRQQCLALESVAVEVQPEPLGALREPVLDEAKSAEDRPAAGF